MITPLLLAQFSNAIYSQSTGWDDYWTLDDVVVARKRVDDTDVIVHRGSAVGSDWVKNFTAYPKWHSQLGYCHAGFLSGMDEVFSEVRVAVGANVAITGHSLGGARARILAGLFAYNKIPVDLLTVFGAPKPGFINLARIIQKSGIVHTSFRNRNDVVPTLALSIAPFLEFVHTEDWQVLNAAPASDNLEPLRDHSIDLYIKALSVA